MTQGSPRVEPHFPFAFVADTPWGEPLLPATIGRVPPDDAERCNDYQISRKRDPGRLRVANVIDLHKSSAYSQLPIYRPTYVQTLLPATEGPARWGVAKVPLRAERKSRHQPACKRGRRDLVRGEKKGSWYTRATGPGTSQARTGCGTSQ